MNSPQLLTTLCVNLTSIILRERSHGGKMYIISFQDNTCTKARLIYSVRNLDTHSANSRGRSSWGATAGGWAGPECWCIRLLKWVPCK